MKTVSIMETKQTEKAEFIARNHSIWVEKGQRLQQCRVEMGFSATFVAEKMGVSRSTLRRFEQGQPVKRADMLERSYTLLLSYYSHCDEIDLLYLEIMKLKTALQQATGEEFQSTGEGSYYLLN